jgi:ferritin-like metal-binding protein YciE
MEEIRTLLVEDLQDLLEAENQLVSALPKMAEAAHHPKLVEAFEKHLTQTQGHVERLQQVFQMLGVEPDGGTPCRAMQGLVEEGEEKIEKGGEKDEMTADLSLIAAAQKIEHYEISAYGTARTLALQLGSHDIARLLSHTLGEEESADYILTAIAKPILQEVAQGSMSKERKPAKSQEPARSQEKAPRVRHA